MIMLEIKASDEQAKALGLNYFDTDEGGHWTKEFETIQESREFRRKHNLELNCVWIDCEGGWREYEPYGRDADMEAAAKLPMEAMERLIKHMDDQDKTIDRIEQVLLTKPWDADALDRIQTIIREHHKRDAKETG
jgi:hypothetical protein